MQPNEIDNDPLGGSAEHRELCRLLHRLAPGVLPHEVFHAIARVIVTVTFVVVPLLRRGTQTLVLLHERDADDPCYPSMLNIPGTVIRPGDEDLSAAYERLVAKEMAGVVIRSGPVFVNNVYAHIARGQELSLVHWVELEAGITSENLYDVESLPEHVVPTDRPRISMAAAHFDQGSTTSNLSSARGGAVRSPSA
jgi:hypothetical protein